MNSFAKKKNLKKFNLLNKKKAPSISRGGFL